GGEDPSSGTGTEGFGTLHLHRGQPTLRHPRACPEDPVQEGALERMAPSTSIVANCRELPGTSPGMTSIGGTSPGMTCVGGTGPGMTGVGEAGRHCKRVGKRAPPPFVKMAIAGSKIVVLAVLPLVEDVARQGDVT